MCNTRRHRVSETNIHIVDQASSSQSSCHGSKAGDASTTVSRQSCSYVNDRCQAFHSLGLRPSFVPSVTTTPTIPLLDLSLDVYYCGSSGSPTSAVIDAPFPRGFIQAHRARYVDCHFSSKQVHSNTCTSHAPSSKRSAVRISTQDNQRCKISLSTSSSSKRVIFSNFWQSKTSDGPESILKGSSYYKYGNASSIRVPGEKKQVRFSPRVLCIGMSKQWRRQSVNSLRKRWWSRNELQQSQQDLTSELLRTSLGLQALMSRKGLMSSLVTEAMHEIYS